MPNESHIDRIEQQLDDIARLGGKAERTAIFTNVTVIDANPAGLTNRVIIQDPRDGDYVPALKVPGVQYTNNDLVNVLFLEGTEPLAFQQASGSSGSNTKVSDLYDSNFSAVAWSVNASGHLSATGAYDLTTTGDIDGADITASGDSMGGAFGYIVKNTSGAAAAAGDAGYLNEDNEYKTTTTASFQTANPVVVLVGAANNSDIYVTRGGGRATVNYTDTAPTTGQFIVFSTTAGKAASAGDVMSPAILARARANGAGGTVEVELLLNRATVPFTSLQSALFINGGNVSDFVSTIAAAGVSGDKIYYNAPSSGNVNAITPATASELAKIVIHNTTQTEEALIIATGSDGGGNFIQVSNSADISGWVATNAITTRSQTNTSTVGSSRWFDLDLSETTEIPETAVAMSITFSYRDTGAVDNRLFSHPFETNANAKRQNTNSTSTANNTDTIHQAIPLIRRRFCVLWSASGTGTAIPLLRIRELIVAV